jgi:hypothetical protein
MKLFNFTIFAASLAFSLFATLACAERQGWSITQADGRFLVALQDAAKNKDQQWIATRVSYPLVIHGNTQITIHDSREFIDHYDQIMSRKVLDAIKNQKPENLFKNIHGVMIGNGEVWFVSVLPDPKQSENLEYYIIGINN